MAKEFKLTADRVKELEEELNYLKTTRMQEVVEDIKEARSQGDLSENSEYDEARNEQAKLFGRIAEIEDILAHAVVIADDAEASGVISLGCNVVIEDQSTGQIMEFHITGSQEANPMQGKMSDDSPFGRALVGRTVGDTVTVEAPAGRFPPRFSGSTGKGGTHGKVCRPIQRPGSQPAGKAGSASGGGNGSLRPNQVYF